MTRSVRVILPHPLAVLARVDREVKITVDGQITTQSILDALEAAQPLLVGTIRDRSTKERRPLVRFFACEEDISHAPPNAPLPDAIADGREPFYVIGAIAGG